jgi:hypothetical protein
MQSGLTVKWQRESKHIFKLEAVKKTRRMANGAKVTINLKHLLAAFVWLSVGLTLSGLVLGIEQFCYRKSLRMHAMIQRRLPMGNQRC